MNFSDCRVGQATQKWATQRGLNVWYSPKTTSTNDVAKEQAALRKERFVLFLAEEQTAGRGRGTNQWLSPSFGSALLSSWVFALNEAPQHLTGPLFGLALFRAVRETYPNLPWGLKAPNDLICEDRKVGGLLLEAIDVGTHRRLIVGLGINVLDAPKLATSASLASLSNWVEFDESRWQLFLEQLMGEFRLALDRCVSSELTVTERDELTAALNQNPSMEQKLKGVTERGDLVYSDHTVPWIDL